MCFRNAGTWVVLAFLKRLIVCAIEVLSLHLVAPSVVILSLGRQRETI